MVPQDIGVRLLVPCHLEIQLKCLDTVSNLFGIVQRCSGSQSIFLDLLYGMFEQWCDLFPFMLFEHMDVVFTPPAVENF